MSCFPDNTEHFVQVSIAQGTLQLIFNVLKLHCSNHLMQYKYVLWGDYAVSQNSIANEICRPCWCRYGSIACWIILPYIIFYIISLLYTCERSVSKNSGLAWPVITWTCWLQWLDKNGANVGLEDPKTRTPKTFVPRQVFSEYIKSVLRDTEAESAGKLTRLQDEAVDLQVGNKNDVEVHFSSWIMDQSLLHTSRWSAYSNSLVSSCAREQSVCESFCLSQSDFSHMANLLLCHSARQWSRFLEQAH